MAAADGFGQQVGEQRLDELDQLALQQVRAAAPAPWTLDLGCGSGTVSGLLAQAGAAVVALDRQDHAQAVQQQAPRQGTGSLRFVQLTLPQGLREWLSTGPRWQLLYSQRMLHYLPRDEALSVLTLLRQHGAPGMAVFLGVSGMASELAQDYAAARLPVQQRYGRLGPAQRQRHGIEAPVCLYSDGELAALAEEAGYRVQRVWVSAFGNVKLVGCARE